MALLLILLPLLAAALAFFIKASALRVRLLPATGLVHLVLLALVLRGWRELPQSAWLGLDALGGWVLLVVSVLFTICALYAPSYLSLRPDRDHRVFTVCILAFLGLASLLALARHPGVVWVAMET
ncbi:MAG: hydrogenase, partial [Acidobacteria bacterium]|nr:hydrogenase [Acidobacteriota bacterium]